MDQSTRIVEREADSIKEQIATSESGAPAGGKAIRDMFSSVEIFERVVATAHEEIGRSVRTLFVSGIAAGLSIGLAFFARAVITAQIGENASPLVGNIFYPLGFVLIVLGRYQLFTENTLTPVTLILTRIASVPALLKVWGISLLGNVIGAGCFAYVLSHTGILEPEATEKALEFGKHAVEIKSFDALFWKSLMAGWIVASMVWLVHAVRESIARLFIVFTLMFLIPSGHLFHCIIGACEVLFTIFNGETTLSEFAYFFSVVVLGNTLGGVILVAILNFSQVREKKIGPEIPKLSTRQWFFGYHTNIKKE